MGQPVRDVGWVSLPPPHPCPQRVFLKGWDRQSIFMMQFIIHTGCLRTYGVAFVCQGSGCFMTVTAGICIGGRLLASSLSSSRMKIDTAPWKRARGRGGGRARSCRTASPRGWVSLAGGNLHPLGNRGDAQSLVGRGFPAWVRTPSLISPDVGVGPTLGGCSDSPSGGWGGGGGEGRHSPPGHKKVLIGGAAASPGQVKGTKLSPVSPS